MSQERIPKDKVEIITLRRFSHRLFCLPYTEKQKIKEQVLHMSSALKLALLAKNCLTLEKNLNPLESYTITPEQFKKNFYTPARLLFDHPEYQALFISFLFTDHLVTKQKAFPKKEKLLSAC